MRKQFLHLALVVTTGLTGVANAATKAETGLLGVKLYDSGLLVLKKFGSPDEIQAVNLGGGGTFGGGNPGGGAGGGGGFPGGGPPAGGGGRGGGGGLAPASDASVSPFDFGNEILRQRGPAGAPGMPGVPSAGGGQGGPGGPPGGFPGGPPGGIPGGGGGGNRGGGAPAAGAGDRVTVTRWVYNKRASKYAFIVDRQGRVVQIEAIGMKDANVRTASKLSFGANFSQLIRTYGNPDGYEISGDNILVKYLTRKKVAFKLSRLGAKQPQVVTGIVVAAGKS